MNFSYLKKTTAFPMDNFLQMIDMVLDDTATNSKGSASVVEMKPRNKEAYLIAEYCYYFERAKRKKKLCLRFREPWYQLTDCRLDSWRIKSTLK